MYSASLFGFEEGNRLYQINIEMNEDNLIRDNSKFDHVDAETNYCNKYHNTVYRFKFKDRSCKQSSNLAKITNTHTLLFM